MSELKAYSLFHVKSFDEEQRVITGMASTPTPDRVEDVVEPLGATFKNPLPFLLYHDSTKPVGTVEFGRPTAKGIPFTAYLPKIAEAGALRDRVEEAWQTIKYKLATGVSIRIRGLKDGVELLKTGGLRFVKSELLELSLVTIPANAEATIQTVKSLDSERGAASGQPVSGVIHKSGASDTPRRVVSIRQETKVMPKTIAEQITGFEAKRAAHVGRMEEITNKALDEGRTKDDAEREEFNTLDAEIKSIDAELVDLRKMESLNKSAARPVVGTTPEAAAASRGAISHVTVKSNAAPGIGFARLAMCIAVAKGNLMHAFEIAKANYPDEQGIQAYLKAAVGAATTANGQAPLLQYTDFFGDFVEYLRPATLLGKFGTTQNGVSIPALRRAMFNMRTSTQTAGGTGYWRGQGKPIPLTKGTFGTITLDFHGVGAISVLTKEEIRFANPNSEAKVRDDLRDALTAKMDQTFIDPTAAAVAGVSPASITYGIAATAVSGTDADAVRTDLKNLITGFISANITPSTLVLMMSEAQALALSLMRNALGQKEFPDLTMKGGMLEGFPVITSQYLASYGSPSTNMIVAVNASDVYLADDGGVTVEASDQASLEMLDGSLVQDGTTGTGTSLVSLWQAGLLGLKAEREVTWKLRRAAACQYLSGVAYT